MVRSLRAVVFVMVALIAAAPASAQILAEAFRNIDCANCTSPDNTYETFLASHSNYNVTLIYYHDNFPAPNDPFYASSNSGVDARVSLYQVIADPALFVDGVNAHSSATTWETITTEAFSQKQPFTISLSSSKNSDDSYTVSMQVKGSLPGTPIRASVIVAESNIQYSNTASYGNPPGNTWNNIYRMTLPSPSGTSPFIANGDTTLTFQFTPPQGQNWVVKNLSVYGLVQDAKAQTDGVSYVIYGGQAEPMGFFQTLGAVSANVENSNAIGNADASPFSQVTHIPVHLMAPAHVKATVTNAIGVQVATIVDDMTPAANSELTFEPHGLASGAYYVSIFVDGTLAAVRPVLYRP